MNLMFNSHALEVQQIADVGFTNDFQLKSSFPSPRPASIRMDEGETFPVSRQRHNRRWQEARLKELKMNATVPSPIGWERGRVRASRTNDFDMTLIFPEAATHI